MVEARCALCGKKGEVPEDHKDYPKMLEGKEKVTYICDMCNNRVRYESENVQKPVKPI